MSIPDYIIIVLYFIGLLVLGGVLSKKIKSSKEMFIAGRNSSWWLSGLSTYMTLFSAGTFVVWGGVAYREGLVAVVIGMTLGFASLLVGRYIAGKWSKMGIDSPAEYISVRFDKPLVKFYTVVGIIGRGVHMAVSLFAISLLMVSLIPLPPDNFFCDPNTGHLAVSYAVLLLGLITLIYTAAGGFIAVLMTDAVQFAVLIAIVLIMVPLSLQSVGGISDFITQSPDGFFAFFSDRYTWKWMILWFFLNLFVIGGDWSFVQRYISTPKAKDAKKNAYLVGVLYLITPIIWYIPSMVYRTIDPNINPEQSYMLMGQHVLGAGTVGLLLAAMVSATLSTVSGTLNVFANVVTYDFYRPFRPKSSEKTLIRAGRVFTYLYGIVITIIAVLIPYLGGAEKVVVWVLTAIIPPLFIPSLWGLYSRRVSAKSVWWTLGLTYLVAVIVKLDWIPGDFIHTHINLINAFNGFGVPVVILLIIELFSRGKEHNSGWIRLSQMYEKGQKEPDPVLVEKNRKASLQYSVMAFKIIMGTFTAIGIIIVLMCFIEDDFHMMLYGIVFLIISIVSFSIYYFKRQKIKDKDYRHV